MPRIEPFVPSLNAGELSPRLHARTDFVKYSAGLAICENGFPLPEGGFMRRPGTRYVSALKSAAVKGRLTHFEFSTTQAYILEFGDSIMRFYRYQGRIDVADTDAAVSNGDFTSNITGWDDASGGSGSIAHDSTNGRLSLDPGGTAASDIASAEQDITTSNTGTEHVIKFRFLGAPGDKMQFQVGTASGGAQDFGPVTREVGYHCIAFMPSASPFYVQFRALGTDQNKVVQIDDVSLIDNDGVEIDTPWPEADLFQVNGPQSADTHYFFHGSYPTHKLLRYGHTTWSLAEIAWEDGPWGDLNETTTTLTPSATTGLGITITASATTGINNGDGFKTTDIGRLIRIDNPASGIAWGYGVIVGHTDTTHVTLDVKVDFGQNAADTRWRLGAWSGTTGYPSAGEFFEQRLFAANTTDQPQTLWASQTSDFENHTPDNRDTDNDETVEDDDALDYTLSASEVNAIRWLSAGEDTLVIGTTGGEWVPSSQGAVITPSDVTIRRQTKHGSAEVQPLRVGNVVLFVQSAKRKIREFGFSFDVDGYVAPDMTRLAQHITYGGLVEMDYAEEPDSLVYAVRNDGQLLTMTYRRDEDVVGWARQIIGGGFYESITQVWNEDVTAETFVDETTDANDAGNADWTVFPASEAIGDYVAFGYTKPFTRIVFDYANGTAGVGGAVDWEYWDGAEWTALSGVSDATSGFTTAAADNLSVTWTEPTDWKRRVLNSGQSLYYVRAKITTVYSTNPVLDQGFLVGNAVVESVAVIPGANGGGQTQDSSDRDEVWVIVKRTIDGATVRYVEFFERVYEEGHDQEDAYYVDSMLTYDSTATASMTGASHIEGETAKIWADGAVQADQVVSSGAFTLDDAANVVQFGLGYTHRIKSLKYDAGNPAGTAVTADKRIYKLGLVLLNSHVLKFGPDMPSLEEVEFREVSDPMDAPAPLFTGEKRYPFPGNFEIDPRIIMLHDAPAPFTLLAQIPNINVQPRK